MADGFIKSLEEQIISNTEAARALFAPILDGPNEAIAFAYLDPKWRLLGVRQAGCGLISAVDVPVRQVAADALLLNAASVVMAHNHPSGDCTPSDADIAITRRLVRALGAMDVKLTDHLILAGGRHSSFREAGLL